MSEPELQVTLTVSEGGGAGRSYELTSPRTTIGRRGTDIVLPDRKVSASHAAIEVEGRRVTLLDLGSRNGVWLNGEKVERAELENLDEIRIGLNKLTIVIVENLALFRKRELPDDAGEKTAAGDIHGMIERELRRFSKWDLGRAASGEIRNPVSPRVTLGLDVIAGPEAGRKIRLDSESATLGRGSADVELRDPDVSRTHARLEIARGEVTLSDLGSTNGTYVNGRRIRRAKVAPGDRIRVGSTVLRLAGED